MAYLHNSNRGIPTICSYLSAVGHLQIVKALPNPSTSSSLAWNTYWKRYAGTHQPPPQVTSAILWLMYCAWSHKPVTHDRITLWAAFCLGFFAFLQSGEFTCQSMDKFRPYRLFPEDVQVDSHENPRYMTIHFRCSEADPFGWGIAVIVGSTGNQLCPVADMNRMSGLQPTYPRTFLPFCMWWNSVARARGTSVARNSLAHELDTIYSMAIVLESGQQCQQPQLGWVTP